jgi:geranylgeranyl pyrophosphate synthase
MIPSQPISLLSLSDFRPLVDQSLREIFDEAIGEAATIDPVYAQLLEITRDQLLRSGKRLRPYLTYLAFAGSGGPGAGSILPVAAGQELFHHFLLIHDDIMDRDLTRHGGPNVAGHYYEAFRARNVSDDESCHHASSYALMAGNASLALGLKAVTDADFDAGLKLAALTNINRMLFEEMGGQLTDISVSVPGGATATEQQLLKIARYKTAAYSFITPLQVGAILAGSPGATPALLKFGSALGVAFQLTDDLLGVYGDEKTLGKPIFSDMREGKRNLLIYYAFESATPSQAKALQAVWGHPESGAAELERVKDLLDTIGAHDKVSSKAESYLRTALDALADAPLSAPAQAALADIARFSVHRQY